MNGALRRTAAALALVALTSSAPALAQEGDPAEAPAVRDPRAAAEARVSAGAREAAWERHRAAWDPARDDLATLSALAGAAAELGDLARFHALLDSVVGAGRVGPNALRYWGAVGLQLGASPDSVAARFAASLERDTSALGLAGLVGVLEAHQAVEPALGLLDAAAAAGVSPDRVALVRGQLLARAGDPDGAVEAWLHALREGGEEAVAAAARIGELAAAGTVPAGTLERLDNLRAASGEVAAAVALLRTRLHAAAGRWSEALAAADDPALGPEGRGEALRGIARAARMAGSPEVAREALQSLVASGAPAARPEDRIALGEIQDETGGPASRQHAAEIKAARQSGVLEGLAGAVERALAAGIDPAIVAVPLGDLLLAGSRPDSALAAYAAGVGETEVGPTGLEALGRVRLVQALARSGTEAAVVAELGQLLVRAPAEPAAASGRLGELAGKLGAADSLDVARSLVLALAAEWLGHAGDPAGASQALERAASEAKSAGEIPALLLAAGRWAEAAGDPEAARRLWRAVIVDHPSTPYALDARRRMAIEGGR